MGIDVLQHKMVPQMVPQRIMYHSPMWRAHSCVPRRDSSRRSLVIYTTSEASVETNLDAARTSATHECARHNIECEY